METQPNFQDQERGYIEQLAQIPSLDVIKNMSEAELKHKLQFNVIANLGFKTTKEMEEDYFVNYAENYSEYFEANKEEIMNLAQNGGWDKAAARVTQELKRKTEMN
jgi:hypothetical protein